MSNSNSLIVAKAGETVSNPVEVSGIIKKISKMTSKKKEYDGVTWISIDITLDSSEGEPSRTISILRTLKQAKSDLRFFAGAKTSVQSLLLSFEAYAKKRPVTLSVSMHEAGAKFIVTPESNYHTNQGGEFETGDPVVMENEGTYVDGFLEIEFDSAHVIAKSNAIEKALAEAEETAL